MTLNARECVDKAQSASTSGVARTLNPGLAGGRVVNHSSFWTPLGPSHDVGRTMHEPSMTRSRASAGAASGAAAASAAEPSGRGHVHGGMT